MEDKYLYRKSYFLTDFLRPWEPRHLGFFWGPWGQKWSSEICLVLSEICTFEDQVKVCFHLRHWFLTLSLPPTHLRPLILTEWLTARINWTFWLNPPFPNDMLLPAEIMSAFYILNHCSFVCEIYTSTCILRKICSFFPLPPLHLFELKSVSGEGEDEKDLFLILRFYSPIFPICITLDTRNKRSYWYFKHGH